MFYQSKLYLTILLNKLVIFVRNKPKIDYLKTSKSGKKKDPLP